MPENISIQSPALAPDAVVARTPPTREKGRRRAPSLPRRIWRARSAYVFIAPFYILFAVFGLFPIGYSVYLAFYSWSGLGPRIYVGWQNFSQLLGDSEFWTSLENTVVLWLGHIFILFAIAICLALLTNFVWLRGRGVFRAIVMAPYMAAIAATSLIFSLFFTYKTGVFDVLLSRIGVDINWLGSSTWSKPSIIILNIWDIAGFYMLIFLAGLQAIDLDLYEAAKVDGAGSWKRFWNITLPGLYRIIVFAFIIETIGSLQIFTEPSVLTNGGPALSSTSLGLYLYDNAFVYSKLGYAATISIALFIFTMAVTAIVGAVFWLLGRKWG
jgi:cellobiose transport system permease protein